MSSKHKKPPTRGSKQIVEENEATVNFYMKMSAGAFLVYIAASFIIGLEFTTTVIVLLVFIAIVYTVCVYLLKYSARVKYSEDRKKIVDSGTDLNVDGGIAEDVKDAIIFSAITQILSLFSNYFWLLLLLVPIKIGYMLWSKLSSLFFENSEKPEDENVEKTKKDKRTKAAHNFKK